QSWQRSILKRMTRVYFGPYLESRGDGRYMVSGQYEGDISKHPAMISLLDYLLHSKRYSASPEEIQEQVWGQSTSSQGWRQKIRNTITRLRDQFPYTMAPLFIHNEDVELFSDVVTLHNGTHHDQDPRDEVIRM